MSGEDPLPGLQTTTFLLCPHMMERELWSRHLLPRAPLPSWRSTLMTSSKPDSLPKAHLQKPSHWRLGPECMDLQRGRHSIHRASFHPLSSHDHPAPASCPAGGWGSALGRPDFCLRTTHILLETDGKPIFMSQCSSEGALSWPVCWLLVVRLGGVGGTPEFSREQRSYKGPNRGDSEKQCDSTWFV